MFNVDLLSPLTLAFVGDSVYELHVREALVREANRPVGELHSLAVKNVRASAQARTVECLIPYMTETELAVFKRGRNAHTSHVPKNSSSRDYSYATGFEALIGFLHLSGQSDRIRELISYAEQKSEASDL